MTIKLVRRATSLTIGDDYAKTNTIEFTIEITGNEAVWLRLQIPVGRDGVLRELADANDLVVKTPAISDSQPKLKTPEKPPEGVNSSNTNEWSLGDYDEGVKVIGKMEMTVAISKVLCRADPGNTAINIIWSAGSSTNSIVPLTITKAKPTSAENPILYFIADPNSLISGDKVTLRWVLADTTKPVSLWFSGNSLSEPQSEMTDSPKESGVYTLKVDNTNNQRTQYVNVLSANQWYTPDLRLGAPASFPAVIFDAGNKSGDALYAIFMLLFEGPKKTIVRKPVLYESANGITGWHLIENGEPPLGMESSPGVRLGNRLWLIGGSTVDWDQKSRRVCYYDLDHADQGWQEATVTGADGFEERMGHACVIVDDHSIWMMGGLGKYECLKDVWKLEIDKTDRNKLHATRLTASSKWWKPRCMFSAVNFNGLIWVCGGVSSPNGNPLGDLWASPSSTMSWEERPASTSGSLVVANAIGTGAAFCGDTLFTVVAIRTGGPSWKVNEEMWEIQTSNIKEKSDSWNKSSAPKLPAVWTSTPHSIALVGFTNRLYLRCLHRNAMYGEVIGAPLFVYVGS